MDLGGIILSGGPASVYADDAPEVPEQLLELGVPVLGICYGMPWMCRALGGDVQGTGEREFGHTEIDVRLAEGPFRGIDGRSIVWMSHGDKVAALPSGFQTYADSPSCEYAGSRSSSGVSVSRVIEWVRVRTRRSASSPGAAMYTSNAMVADNRRRKQFWVLYQVQSLGNISFSISIMTPSDKSSISF